MRFIASLLIAFALLLTPLAMAGDHGMAMAHGAAAATSVPDGHCADSQAPDEGDRKAAKMDCMSACSAVAPAVPALAGPASPPSSASTAAKPTVLAGLPPESATPPPRAS